MLKFNLGQQCNRISGPRKAQCLRLTLGPKACPYHREVSQRSMRKYRKQKLKLGLCTMCLKRRPENTFKTTCDQCIEYKQFARRHLSQAYKHFGFCACGKARAVNSTRCERCIKHDYKRKREKRNKLSAAKLIKTKAALRYAAAKASGICVRCYTLTAEPQYFKCLKCLIKHAEADRKHYNGMSAIQRAKVEQQRRESGERQKAGTAKQRSTPYTSRRLDDE